jgi:hypothetical protein
MRTALLLILLAFTSSVLGQEKANWQGIPFGATDAQIARSPVPTEKLASREKFGEDKQYVERVIKSYDVAGIRFHVSFAMGDKSSQLEEVYMITYLQDGFDVRPSFDRLSRALSEKYGTHTFENERRGSLPMFERSWRAGEVAIRLLGLVAAKVVILTYKPRIGGDSSKL